MARWLNTYEVVCPDENRKSEWIEWYKKIHAPDILETPGFLSARLSESKEFRDGRGQFFTMYEIETDDIEKTIKIRQDKRAKEIEAGRGSTAFLPVWRDVVWRQINQVSADKKHDTKLQRWLNLVDLNCADSSKEKDFNEWYDKVYLSNVLEIPGFMAATRYEIKEFRDGRGKYLTIYEIETGDIEKTLEISKENHVEKKELGRQNELCVLVWRDVLWRLIFELVK
jgi:hypothetical protein